MLSGAITAGVAPLLFVQILYKEGYYTANLLLFNRWMAILPVLIAGFYGLYLLESGWLTRRANWVVAAVSVLPFACVAFTGYSWTENHLLSVRPPDEWAAFYRTRAQWYTEPQLVPRLLVWAFGAVPTMLTILGWQLWSRRETHATDPHAGWLAKLALGGLVAAGAAAGGYYLATDDTTRNAFVGPMALPYFIAAIAGLGLQAVGWVRSAAAGRWAAANLGLSTAGLVLTIGGMTVCREAVRIATLGPERFAALHPVHDEALGKSGSIAFGVFFVVNSGLIALCFWVVRTQTVPAEPGEPTH